MSAPNESAYDDLLTRTQYPPLRRRNRFEAVLKLVVGGACQLYVSDLKARLESVAKEGSDRRGARSVAVEPIGVAANVLREAAVKANLDKKEVRMNRTSFSTGRKHSES